MCAPTKKRNMKWKREERKRKKKKLKIESRLRLHVIKMFPRFFNKSHVVSTSCVDIGVKLNAHIPKISTAPGHQRVYHPVLNIAGRKHRWIPSQKSACNPTLRVPIPPFLPRDARNTNFLTANRNNGHTLIKSFSRVRSSSARANQLNGRREDFPEFNDFNNFSN